MDRFDSSPSADFATCTEILQEQHSRRGVFEVQCIRIVATLLMNKMELISSVNVEVEHTFSIPSYRLLMLLATTVTTAGKNIGLPPFLLSGSGRQ